MQIGVLCSNAHIPALERTYLSYLRTSLAFVNLGVAIQQLFRLQAGSDTLQNGFYKFGKPLAAVFICAGILICLKGGWRFYRQQSAMVRGKIIVSGWELFAIMLLSIVVMVTLFGVIVGVSA